MMKLPWSAGHEIVYENAAEKGKEVRAMTVEEVLEMVELFAEAAWRVKEGALFGLSLDDQLLFNANNAIMNDLPLDVRRQLLG